MTRFEEALLATGLVVAICVVLFSGMFGLIRLGEHYPKTAITTGVVAWLVLSFTLFYFGLE